LTVFVIVTIKSKENQLTLISNGCKEYETNSDILEKSRFSQQRMRIEDKMAIDKQETDHQLSRDYCTHDNLSQMNKVYCLELRMRIAR
jgi:hypothetical protein